MFSNSDNFIIHPTTKVAILPTRHVANIKRNGIYKIFTLTIH